MANSTNKSTDDVLRALLDVELKPQKAVHMKRFGVDFVIQAIDGKTVQRVRDQASFPVKGGGKKLDGDLFGSLLIAKACVTPDWNDKQLLASFGPTAADAIQYRLLAGEISKLTEEILSLSGFGDDEDIIEDVKN